MNKKASTGYKNPWRLSFRHLLDKSGHGFLQQDVMVFGLRLLAGKKSPSIFLTFSGQFIQRRRAPVRDNKKRTGNQVQGSVQMD
jgi:hypothetical protein